jgi:hypothetical protein
MMETRIDAPGDFPNLAIYRRDEAAGPVYRIVFTNLEYVRGPAMAFKMLLALAAFMMFWPVSCAVVTNIDSPWGLLVFPAGGLAMAAAWQWANAPVRVARAIELDKAADRLRVLQKGRVEIERTLSRLVDLRLAEHPKAQYERVRRQEMRPNDPQSRKTSDAEKQHCLMGYFGRGGAEQVVLLCRAEWPCLNSLREVQEAINWTKEIVYSQSGGRRAEPGSMNPPRL